MKTKPNIVGVTGGIGSGKSTVCRIFESLGAVTYYADDRAKWLMTNDQDLIKGIKNLFGDDVYVKGELNRQHIAGIAFKDQSILEQLNKLVHPAVAEDVEIWAKKHAKASLLLKEAALLFETGSYKALDKNILVTAPHEVRVERVIRRDAHRTAEDVKAIITRQLSDEDKIPLADYVIENDGEKSLIKQVMEIFPLLIT